MFIQDTKIFQEEFSSKTSMKVVLQGEKILNLSELVITLETRFVSFVSTIYHQIYILWNYLVEILIRSRSL
jgi:hypothetical protein